MRIISTLFITLNFSVDSRKNAFKSYSTSGGRYIPSVGGGTRHLVGVQTAEVQTAGAMPGAHAPCPEMYPKK